MTNNRFVVCKLGADLDIDERDPVATPNGMAAPRRRQRDVRFAFTCVNKIICIYFEVYIYIMAARFAWRGFINTLC